MNDTATKIIHAHDSLPDGPYDGRDFWLTLGPLYRDGRRMFHAWAQNGDQRHTVTVLVLPTGDDITTLRIDHYIGAYGVNATPYRTIVVMTPHTSYYETPAALAAILHQYGYLTD